MTSDLQFFSLFNSKYSIVIISVFIVLLVIENVDAIVARFLAQFNTSTVGMALFVIICIGYILGQFILLRFMNSSSHAIKARSSLVSNLHKAVSIVQWVLVANIILLIIQMAFFSSYSLLSLVFVAYVANFFTAGLLAVFALRFFSWYRNGNHSSGILLYALAFIILATAEVFAGIGSGYLLWQKDDIITPASEVHFRNFPEGSLLDIFFSSYSYVDYSSFLLTLVASALLLYHYSKKARTPKMIIIVALPVLGYTATILDALNIYDTATNPDLFYYYIFQILAAISGGALFAFSFWFISKRLPQSPVKTFLKITALGFVILYLSNHIDVNSGPYPPFGINSLSLLPLSSYFVLFGLYSSALSLSQDITLRNHLRSMARNDQNLLSSIGTAQMETEVKRAVTELKDVADMEEKELAEKTGIETPIAENEVEDYLKQVIEEVSRARKKD
ncbi:MAG TPA: hypothetical protein VJ799_09230 [Nitrososphaeraceae archaeon]|nr:hypothetical protein [Nitrososphaeraceae archaeon]